METILGPAALISKWLLLYVDCVWTAAHLYSSTTSCPKWFDGFTLNSRLMKAYIFIIIVF